MQQYKFILPPTEVKHPVIARSQFPDIFYQMLRNIFRQPRPAVLQQLDIKCDLLMLYPGVFIRCTFYAQFFQKVPQFRDAVCVFIKFNFIHFTFSSTKLLSSGL